MCTSAKSVPTAAHEPEYQHVTGIEKWSFHELPHGKHVTMSSSNFRFCGFFDVSLAKQKFQPACV